MPITIKKSEMKRQFWIARKRMLLFLSFLSVVACTFTGCSTLASAARGGAVGYGAGSAGYSYIGNRSSESECRALAESLGYSQYLYDSQNGACYAK